MHFCPVFVRQTLSDGATLKPDPKKGEPPKLEKSEGTNGPKMKGRSGIRKKIFILVWSKILPNFVFLISIFLLFSLSVCYRWKKCIENKMTLLSIEKRKKLLMKKKSLVGMAICT